MEWIKIIVVLGTVVFLAVALRPLVKEIARQRREQKYCPHARIRGVYGDEIIHMANWRRLQCLDCYRYLDGDLELVNVGPKPRRAA